MVCRLMAIASGYFVFVLGRRGAPRGRGRPGLFVCAQCEVLRCFGIYMAHGSWRYIRSAWNGSVQPRLGEVRRAETPAMAE